MDSLLHTKLNYGTGVSSTLPPYHSVGQMFHREQLETDPA